jgi:hypothetical protein
MNEGLRQFFITNWAALLSIAPIDDLFDCLLTRALAVELAPICVNAMSPGVVRTNLWQNMGAAERENLYEALARVCQLAESEKLMTSHKLTCLDAGRIQHWADCRCRWWNGLLSIRLDASFSHLPVIYDPAVTADRTKSRKTRVLGGT